MHPWQFISITNIEKINYILFPPYISAKNIICDFINRNGHKIQGLTDNLVINVNRAAQGLVYYNATQGWILSEN